MPVPSSLLPAPSLVSALACSGLHRAVSCLPTREYEHFYSMEQPLTRLDRTEAQKGRFIGIFWTIFNLGGVIGSAVAFGTNYHSTANSVGNGTYIGFLVLTAIGIFIPLLMADPKKMVRTDGTRVTTIMHPSWRSEILGLWIALRTDPFIILLFPMFLASNWFYTWRKCLSIGIMNIRVLILDQNSMPTMAHFSIFVLVPSTAWCTGCRRCLVPWLSVFCSTPSDSHVVRVLSQAGSSFSSWSSSSMAGATTTRSE
jgi:hypothetical protein